MNVAEIVERYIELRDEKAHIKALTDEQLKPIQESLDRIEIQLLAAADQLGVDSFKTPNGTAYVSNRVTTSVADKDIFMKFLEENDEWPLLEVRAAKSAVEQYKAIHGTLPPGVNWSEERTVSIRRKT